MHENTAIELYKRIERPLDAIAVMGQNFAQSAMFGAGSVAQGFVIALTCFTEGISPIQFNRTYHIIDNKLSKKALACLAEFRGKGGKHKWIATGADGQKATGEFSFEGSSIIESFTIDQAKQQMLNFKPGSNWTKTPANMLRARVITNAIGMLCPEILAGGDTGEEEEPEPKPLNLAPAETTTATVLPPPVTKVDPPGMVSTSKESQPNSISATTAPAAPASAPAPVTGTAPVTPSPATNAQETSLPLIAEVGQTEADNLVRNLEEILKDHGPTAVSWMMKNNWLKAGQNFYFLRAAQARRIIQNRESFLKSISTPAAA